MTAPSYRATLSTYLGPLRGRVVVLVLLLLGSIGLQLVIPLIMRTFIDAAVAQSAVSGMTTAAIAYLIAGILNQLLDAGASYLGTDIGWSATNRLREELTSHLFGLDMGFHNDTTPGEMIERVDGDVTALSQFISRFLVRLIAAGVLLTGVVVVCWFESPVMGLTITIYVLLVLTLLVRLRKLAVAAAEEERETSARLYGFIEERLAGIDDIRALGAGRFTMVRFVPVIRDFFTRTSIAWRKRIVVWVSANTAFWAGDALALIVGVWLTVQGSITVGTAYLILQYVQLVRSPIEQMTQELQELQKAAGGIVRIDHLRQLGTSIVDGDFELPTGPLSVEFEDVSFAYEERGVLEEVTFGLEPGQSLGLLGRTGGGKTTITRLIARLYDPDHGVVRVGGHDLRNIRSESLRQSIGVVTQDVQLFRATVKDNLTFFEPRSDDEILTALDAVGLGSWIREVGLDTELGSGGQGLSAGEQQLLAFARVFLQDPGMVILDEPSSRLDPVTEMLLATATERLFAGRTVVIIAHRLETVRTADQIMVVEAGRIVEHGLREDLAGDRESRYATLLATGRGGLLGDTRP
ncbi:MAG: ABC transporter ATP-binding protein/permease [Actinomycetota bacterium]|nr:ABC transporter ATP-binding protein/permease [Actinomycetota bacterium]